MSSFNLILTASTFDTAASHLSLTRVEREKTVGKERRRRVEVVEAGGKEVVELSGLNPRD